MPVKCVTKKSKIPSEIRSLLGRSPTLRSEDEKTYEEFLRSVADAVCPKDVLECVLMKNYVDLQWEIHRYRLAKSRLIDGARKEALQAILESILEPDDFEHAIDSSLEAA